jgi:peroxiredoxin
MKQMLVSVCLASSLAVAGACRSGAANSAFDAQGSSASASATSTTNAAVATAAAPAPLPATGQVQKIVAGKAVLGEQAPDFTLSDVNGKTVKLSQYKGKAIVLEWFNPTCPYCQDVYKEGGVLREMPERWMREGVVWLSINSQGPEEAGSGIEENKKFMRENEMRTPLLMDPTGAVGKAYGAKTTPHVFVISEKGVLVYRGALDNAPRGVVPPKDVKTNYVESALKDLKAGHAVVVNETRPYG